METLMTGDERLKLTKRGRGRPKKYASAEEQKVARRAQILRSVRRWRQKQAGLQREQGSPPNLASPTPESTTASSAATNDASSISPDLATVSLAQPVTTSSPEYAPSRERSLSNSSVRSNELVKAHMWSLGMRKAPELVTHDGLQLIENLFSDFMTFTRNTDTWWPFTATTKLAGRAGEFASRAHIAGLAANVGMAKGDQGLMDIADAANLHTIKALRQYTTDAHITRLAIPLIIMAYQSINYEFKEFLRDSTSVPITGTWALHGQAAIRMVYQAGPDAFRSGIGARLLLGLLPQTVMTACGIRTGLFLTSAEWLDILQNLHFPDSKDSIWLHAVHIPGLMQELDSLTIDTCSPSGHALSVDISALRVLYRRVKALDAALDKWQTDFLAMKGDLGHHWSSTSQGPVTDPFFPRIEFATVCAAQCTMLYWTFKLLLAILATDTSSHILAHDESRLRPRACSFTPTISMSYTYQSSPPDPTKYDYDDSPIRYTNWICRAIPYFMQTPDLSSMTMYNCLSWPLRIAWQWFVKQSATDHVYKEKAAWCAEISRQLRSQPLGKRGEFVVDYACGLPT